MGKKVRETRRSVSMSVYRIAVINIYTLWFRLWTNPNRTLPNSMIKKKKKTIGLLLVPLPNSNLPSLPSLTTVAVGSEIYAIGGPVDRSPSSAVRVFDCRTHTWRDAPSMSVARSYVLTCVYDGKIYVFRVEEDEPWAEVFDTKTQTWERLFDPGNEVRKFSVSRISEVEGKIYLACTTNKTHAYDTKLGKWKCCVGLIPMVPRLGHVMENISHFFDGDSLRYDGENAGNWKKVKGLDLLEDMYRKNVGSSSRIPKVVRCGGKVFIIWEGKYMRIKPNYMKKIWCAEIVLQKRYGGEIWGNVQWVDAVLTVPMESRLLHYHAVSV